MSVWTTPKVWKPGDEPNSADLNTYVAENLNYLKSAGGVSGCAVARAGSSQTYTSAVWAAYVPDTTLFDVGGYVSGSNIILPTDGYYNLWAYVEFNASSGGNQRLCAYCPLGSTGSNYYIIGRHSPMSAVVTSEVQFSVWRFLTAGTNMHLDLYQDSGGNLGTNQSAYTSVWGVQRHPTI